MNDRREEPKNGNNMRGWQAFFLLVTFILGNGVSYLVFGLNTVKRSDFDAAQTENRANFETQAENLLKTQRALDTLTVELKTEKLIQNY
jgi:hypothetical protein